MDLSCLPKEIIECIIPYTYSPQSVELCEDIRSFTSTLRIIKEKYHQIYLNIESENDLEWLSNDILCFMNNDKPTMLTYTDFYISLYQRLYTYKTYTKPQIIYSSEKICEDRFPNDIRIHIGCMTPNERNQFIKYSYLLYDSE